MQINKIYNESCLDTMGRMDDNFIDLTVTSPPYDNLRSYKNGVGDMWGEHIWKPVIQELYRVTKEGGVVVWVVGDATIKGSETGTSFRQALCAMECGFNLHDTMIWEKTGQGAVGSNHCYWQNFEYMFIFSKGKPKSMNFIADRENKTVGEMKTSGSRGKDGMSKSHRTIVSKPLGRRFNIWKINQATNKKHKAVFPEQLAKDHVISWSNEGDLVYDPFMGSGTTAKMAVLNNRNWIGSEIAKEYCDIINKRVIK